MLTELKQAHCICWLCTCRKCRLARTVRSSTLELTRRLGGCALQAETLYKGHLLESETYIGGKVEALESGVFRSDLPTRFKCKQEAYQGLIDVLDRDLTYALTHEAGWDMSDVANYEDVKAEITTMLEDLRDAPNRCARAGMLAQLHPTRQPPCATHLRLACPEAGLSQLCILADSRPLSRCVELLLCAAVALLQGGGAPHLSPGCCSHVPQHHPHKPPAAVSHCHRRGLCCM